MLCQTYVKKQAIEVTVRNYWPLLIKVEQLGQTRSLPLAICLTFTDNMLR